MSLRYVADTKVPSGDALARGASLDLERRVIDVYAFRRRSSTTYR
jgi:hypothetical protein